MNYLPPTFYFMKFVYDKGVDKECHQRLETCDNIFGEQKKKDIYPVTPNIVKTFDNTWTHEINTHFKKGMFEIFNEPFPDEFTCYINSTPYSMDTSGGISISASSRKTLIKLVCHEASHYMFRRSGYKDTYFPEKDMEDAKEIFTVINNIYFRDIMESPDNGWNKFWKDRYAFLIVWVQDHLK